MTAQSMAIACSMAVLAMGAIDRAAAFDDQQTVAFDRAGGIDGSVTDPVAAVAATDNEFDRYYDAIVLDHLRTRTSGHKGRARGEKPRSTFTPYAGIGFDKIKLAMDFESGDVALKKDKGFTRPRLILGMGYAVTEDFSLGLEYRALAADEPLFSYDVGSETMNVDTRFTRHHLFLTAKYKF